MSRERRAEEWTVWPCDHGGVQREFTKAPANYACAICGALPIRVIPASSLERFAERVAARLNAKAEDSNSRGASGFASGVFWAAHLLRESVQGKGESE